MVSVDIAVLEVSFWALLTIVKLSWKFLTLIISNNNNNNSCFWDIQASASKNGGTLKCEFGSFKVIENGAVRIDRPYTTFFVIIGLPLHIVLPTIFELFDLE